MELRFDNQQCKYRNRTTVGNASALELANRRSTTETYRKSDGIRLATNRTTATPSNRDCKQQRRNDHPRPVRLYKIQNQHVPHRCKIKKVTPSATIRLPTNTKPASMIHSLIFLFFMISLTLGAYHYITELPAMRMSFRSQNVLLRKAIRFWMLSCVIELFGTMS